MGVEQRFDQFAVGDHVVFTRRFDSRDRVAFTELSGDRSPLHQDARYAQSFGFDRPTVPLQLILAPISRIAGMVFPGEPSLCLTQEVRAVAPILYDEEITYSARVIAVSPSQRVLTLRILGLVDARVIVDVTMQVQARVESWATPPAEPIRRGPGTALVTGAGGEIGAAVARRLANAGYHLMLHARESERSNSRRESLLASLGACDVHFIEADLASVDGRARLCSAVRRVEDLSLVVHAASPRIDSPLSALMEVNFTALGDLAKAALPAMLRRQEGAIVVLGSTAAGSQPVGWEAYVGSKVAAASLLDGLHRRYASYGVRGLVIALGYVRTGYSRAYLPPGEEVLLPEEVAEVLLEIVASSSGDRYHVVDVRGRNSGRFGFVATSTCSPAAPNVPGTVDSVPALPGPSHSGAADLALKPGQASADVLASVVRRVLRLPAAESLDNAGLGLTSLWDSLRHIELLLEVESALGIHFTSGEIESTRRFRDLALLCHRKLNEPGSPRS